ncbi:hypothetical protein [Phaeocystidibacter luteus]|uniref:Porin family protein n=1 Tax=Phaeocystidibacter luteus TaxID=911197 RepID=A0A6N6RF93_9FLAO|nr:hypothetical protein [Phaeocystidibacter luteus]KAB2809826.1 hypothetical protein F8C67_09745 [Phaeocystidibacter luteus]
MKHQSITVLLLLLVPMQSFAQEAEEPTYSSLSLSIGHTLVFEGVRDGERTPVSLPSWALDYNYYIHERWIVGLHTDVIFESFEFETPSDGDAVFERNFPVATVGIVGHRIGRWFMYAGGGAEFGDETFGVVRLGGEVAHSFDEHYEMLLGIAYDYKVEHYSSLAITAGVAYKF